MRYYVYVHYKPEGDPFYVGKGTKGRAYTSGKRSWGWTKIVEECGGVDVRIIKNFDDEQEAFLFEKQLIRDLRHKGYNLINASDGGKGPNGYKQTADLRRRKSRMMRGYKFNIVTCPHCGFSGGETSTKRWHFDNCTGLKLHRARATVHGKRVFLGSYATKAEAEMAVLRFKAEAA